MEGKIRIELEGLQSELEYVRRLQKNTIRDYCDSIGCKNCPLQEPDGNCYSIQLQNRECNLEERIV